MTSSGRLAVTGLLGTTTTPVVAAEAVPSTPSLATFVNYSDLSADCRALLEQMREEEAAYWKAHDALNETLSPEQRKLFITFSDAQGDRAATYHEWVNAETARHLPGLSAAIRLVWFHIIGERKNAMSEC